jgi:hypothetical protein
MLSGREAAKLGLRAGMACSWSVPASLGKVGGLGQWSARWRVQSHAVASTGTGGRAHHGVMTGRRMHYSDVP